MARHRAASTVGDLHLAVCRAVGAAIEHGVNDLAGAARFDELVTAGPVPEPGATPAQVRAWAVASGLDVSDRGRLRPEIWEAYRADVLEAIQAI